MTTTNPGPRRRVLGGAHDPMSGLTRHRGSAMDTRGPSATPACPARGGPTHQNTKSLLALASRSTPKLLAKVWTTPPAPLANRRATPTLGNASPRDTPDACNESTQPTHAASRQGLQLPTNRRRERQATRREAFCRLTPHTTHAAMPTHVRCQTESLTGPSAPSGDKQKTCDGKGTHSTPHGQTLVRRNHMHTTWQKFDTGRIQGTTMSNATRAPRTGRRTTIQTPRRRSANALRILAPKNARDNTQTHASSQPC